MFIDKKGKIFNKISIIDLLIVFLLIFFAINLYSSQREITQTNTKVSQKAIMTLEFEEVNESFLEVINKDDILKDSVRGFVVGKVISFNYKPSKKIVSSNDGKVVYKEIDDKVDIKVDLTIEGIFDGNGVLIGSKRYYIGSETRIKSSDYVTDANVIMIKKKE
ncbi:MAG: DUF4330 domain-containing protein [Bacillota bacterium]